MQRNNRRKQEKVEQYVRSNVDTVSREASLETRPIAYRILTIFCHPTVYQKMTVDLTASSGITALSIYARTTGLY